MLLRLLPEQVNERWEDIAPTIANALPPGVRMTRNGLTNILSAILLEDADLWVVTDDKSREIRGFVLTYFNKHQLTRLKRLEIYAVAATESATREDIREVLDTLEEYALSRGCKKIIGYAQDSKWLRMLRMLGAKTDFTLIEFDLR